MDSSIVFSPIRISWASSLSIVTNPFDNLLDSFWIHEISPSLGWYFLSKFRLLIKLSNHFVFLFGDYDDRIDEVNMYNADADSWTKLSTNFIGRRHAAVVRNGDWIYVIGGWDGTNNYDIVQKCKPY